MRTFFASLRRLLSILSTPDSTHNTHNTSDSAAAAPVFNYWSVVYTRTELPAPPMVRDLREVR